MLKSAKVTVSTLNASLTRGKFGPWIIVNEADKYLLTPYVMMKIDYRVLERFKLKETELPETNSKIIINKGEWVFVADDAAPNGKRLWADASVSFDNGTATKMVPRIAYKHQTHIEMGTNEAVALFDLAPDSKRHERHTHDYGVRADFLELVGWNLGGTYDIYLNAGVKGQHLLTYSGKTELQALVMGITL